MASRLSEEAIRAINGGGNAPAGTPTQGQQSGYVGLDFGATPTSSQQDFTKIFGNNPQDYAGTFNTANTNRGQAGSVDPAVVANGTYALANAFIDRLQQKTGKLPTEDDVRQFVAQNLNSGFASKFLQGIPTDQIISNYVDPHIQANPKLLGQQDNAGQNIQNDMTGLNNQVTSLYGQAANNISNAYDTGFAEPRRQAISDEAALGRLRSPVSIPTIAGVDTARETGKNQALAGLYGNQANASLDIGKTVQGLLAGERRAGEQVQQFGQNYGLARNAQAEGLYNDDYQRGLQQQQLGLASQIGRAQADASKPGALDYLNTALSGISAIGTAAGGAGGLLKALK